mgnify:CR=1 FL=1
MKISDKVIQQICNPDRLTSAFREKLQQCHSGENTTTDKDQLHRVLNNYVDYLETEQTDLADDTVYSKAWLNA